MSFAFVFTKNTPDTGYKPLLKSEANYTPTPPKRIEDCRYTFDRELYRENDVLEDSAIAAIENRANHILNDADIRHVLFSALADVQATFWLQDGMDETHFSIATYQDEDFILEIVCEDEIISVVCWDMRTMFVG